MRRSTIHRVPVVFHVPAQDDMAGEVLEFMAKKKRGQITFHIDHNGLVASIVCVAHGRTREG